MIIVVDVNAMQKSDDSDKDGSDAKTLLRAVCAAIEALSLDCMSQSGAAASVQSALEKRQSSLGVDRKSAATDFRQLSLGTSLIRRSVPRWQDRDPSRGDASKWWI